MPRKTTSRRQFLEESMIATALTAAAGVSPVRAQTSQPSRLSTNETISHAIIGCRIRGRAHASEFTKIAGVDVSHVCDPDRKLADELADSVEKQQGRRPKAVQDLRYIMDDTSVNTVSIAAPNHWHALAAIWAMQAGKDVYVEKPVSHNVAEGRRIVQVARKTKRLCQTGTQRRSSGPLAVAAQYIRDGHLGEVDFARSIIYGRRNSIGAHGKYRVPDHIDYNLWLGPAPHVALERPNLHYDWHWVWDTGNGELGNNNIHIVDICRWLMGLTGLGDSVISVGGRLGYEDAGQTPNTQMVVHDFGEQTIVQEVRGLKSDPFSEKFSAGWIVHGTEGFIAETSLFDRSGKLVKTFEAPSENHFGNFIKAVRSRRQQDLKADILEGHQSSSLCHLGNISHRLGHADTPDTISSQLEEYDLHEDVPRTFARMTSHLHENGVDLEKSRLAIGPLLHIDSEREAFVDNPRADALLTRHYRAPFVVPSEDDSTRQPRRTLQHVTESG